MSRTPPRRDLLVELRGLLASRILRRILLGFTLVASVLGVGLVAAGRQFETLNARFEALLDRDIAVLDDLEVLARVTSVLQSNKRGFMLTGDPDFLRRYDDSHDAIRAALGRLRARAEGRPEHTEAIAAIERDIERYVAASQHDIATRARVNRGELPVGAAVEAASRTASMHLIAGAEQRLASLHERELRSFRAQRDSVRDATARSRLLAVTCMVAALLVALVYGGAVAGDIGAALGAVRRSIEAAARREPGDTPLERSDEIGELSRSFHDMAAKLERYDAELRERVRAQGETLAELRRSNDALARAMRVKSDFLATMSHELRTPLNAVIGLSALLLDSPREQLSARARQALATMRGSGEHLLALLNDILDLAKVDAGKMSFVAEPVDCTNLAHTAVATVAPLFGDKPIEVTIDAPAGVTAWADPQRTRQVLLNLLSNAARYTERGSVRVVVAREGDRVVVRVIDTGVGIAREHQAKLFEDFQQVETGDRRAHGGTGLGLALSRRMARAMGGDITVESEAGRGSTFTVTLPTSATHAPEAGR